METIVLLVHLLAAVVVIGLIMLQQGKGAEMGASFGSGASQTLFGSAGSGNFFSRMTAIFATIFFVTSFSLAVIAKQQTSVDDDLDLPTLEQVDTSAEEVAAPEGDVPVVEGETVDAEAVDTAAADVADLDAEAEDAAPVDADVPATDDVPAEQ